MALLEFPLHTLDWTLTGYYPGQWHATNRHSGGSELGPFPATVPGAVQADLLAAGVIPNPYWEEQSRLSEWVATRHWEYACVFTPPAEFRGKRIMLIFDGLEPGGRVLLNGKLLVELSRAEATLEVEITEQIQLSRPNRLQVILFEAPARQNQFGAAEKETMPGARFAAKWDFGTRYPPVGLSQGVRLAAFRKQRLHDLWVRSHANMHERIAGLSAVITIASPHAAYEVSSSLYDGEKLISSSVSRHSGMKAMQQITHEHVIHAPEYWWPNGYGAQHRYRFVAEVFDEEDEISDRQEVGIGIRSLRYVRNEGAPSSALPYTLVVNGTPIFLKGWNIVPLDHLAGPENTAKLRRLLEMVRAAGGNAVRVWGGGEMAGETCYRLCDELGLLVWQDFPLTGSGQSSLPPTDARYLAQWETMAPPLIRARRNHPSLAIWCGGADLLDRDLRPATTKEPALGLLAKLVREHDPDRLFLPATPSGPIATPEREHPEETAADQHDIHGPWRYLGAEAHYAYLNGMAPLLQSACGCPGAARHDALRLCTREERLWPPTEGNALWRHRAQRWIDLPMLETLFGPLENMTQYIQVSQWLQAEGIRALIEANRRRKWRSSGIILWQLNEPWPNFCCTNVVDYFGQAKPAYYAAANSFRPEVVIARYARLGWKPGERFLADLYVINNLERTHPSEVTWAFYDMYGRIQESRSVEALSHPNAVSQVAAVEYAIPADYAKPFLLRLTLTSEGEFIHQNDYLFSAAPVPIFTPLLASPPARLLSTGRLEDDQLMVSVTNIGEQIALGVTVDRRDGHWLAGAENYRHLLPGECWTTRFTPLTREGFYMSLDHRPERRELLLSAWNSPPVVVGREETAQASRAG